MKAVLDIPDASLLALFNIEDLVQIFCVNAGVESPDVICLPLYDEGGPQFESKFTSRENSMWPRYLLEKEVQKIRKRYPQTQIYLSIMPTLPSVKASHLTCRNQYGEETTGACLANPYVQKVILDIVSDALGRFEPNGIVFDIVDIHGQTSRGRGKPVDISCFCSYCRESLLEWKFDASVFSQRVSPLSLVLEATDTGVRFITPKTHFTPEQLVDLAIKEEYVRTDDEQTRRWAQVVLDYIRARSKVTGIMVGEICHRIKQSFPSIRTGAILNNAFFDWTGGTDMHGMTGQIDEVWLDIEDSTAATVPANLNVLAYTADRARYRIDAFFEIASDRRFIESAVSRQGVEYIIGRLRERAGQLGQVQNLNKTFVNSISKMDYLEGFVGIPYDKKLYLQVMQAVTEEANLMAADIQVKPSTVSKELVRQYIALLVQNREQGNDLNRREIIGLAGQLGLID
ncbi:MAG: hypothetical protein U0175_05010 [Caldilineaceae bacterium]